MPTAPTEITKNPTDQSVSRQTSGPPARPDRLMLDGLIYFVLLFFFTTLPDDKQKSGWGRGGFAVTLAGIRYDTLRPSFAA